MLLFNYMDVINNAFRNGDFNTSNVTIQRKVCINSAAFSEFQYI